jgi:hypothetical protein
MQNLPSSGLSTPQRGQSMMFSFRGGYIAGSGKMQGKFCLVVYQSGLVKNFFLKQGEAGTSL